MIFKLRKRLASLAYSNEQVGLVFMLLAALLLLLPISVYGSVFFADVSTNEVNKYTKYSAIFTVIGSIFTILNTVVVIVLMVWLHKKEASISMLPHISDLNNKLIEVHSLLKLEIEYFEEALHSLYLEGEYGLHIEDNDYNAEQLYNDELSSLTKINNDIKKLLTDFFGFKNSINNIPNISLTQYQKATSTLNIINEILIINKPSVAYKQSFIYGNRIEADPEDMVSAAEHNALESINAMSNQIKQHLGIF